jgi:hypothetical protein
LLGAAIQPDEAPAVPVQIVPDDFHAVAQQFVTAQDDLERIRENLLTGLDAANGAAGACDGAQQYETSWAAALDNIVNDGFHTAFDLLGAIGYGIDVSAVNHWTAAHDSIPGRPSTPPPWAPVTPHPWPANSDFAILTGPSSWWLPGFLDKYVPTADTGRLDNAAETCRTTATAIRDLATRLHTTLESLLGNNTSADLDELDQFWQQAAGPQSILTGLPQALDDVANSLMDFRIWNDHTQEAIKDKIKAVIDGLGVIGAVVAIGSILTDGGLDAIIAAVVEALELVGVDAEGALAAPIAEVATTAATALAAAGGAIAIAGGVGPAIQAAMSSTPNPNVEGIDATKISDELGADTQPTRAPDPNATPSGQPTRVPKNADPETTRSLQRENESATTLSRAGYDVEQNPTVPGPKNPDYRINGTVFDNLAPSSGNVRNIASEMAKKVKKGQTERVVLNLTDTSVDSATMHAQLHDWPIEGLKEVIAIDKQGNIIHIYP